MKISYLVNSFIFLEMYNEVQNEKMIVKDIKINPIIKYLKNEEKEKVYENIRSLAVEVEKIEVDNTNNIKEFKGMTVKQVSAYPVESFNIDAFEGIGLPIDSIEKIKSIIFLCCSNISLLINKNSLDIENKIEDVMMDVRKFTMSEESGKIIDIMIKCDENTLNDLIISINVNKELISGTENIDPEKCTSEVVSMIDEISEQIKEDVISLLIEDECIIRIFKDDNTVMFKANDAIINQLSQEKRDIIRDKSINLVSLLSNN